MKLLIAIPLVLAAAAGGGAAGLMLAPGGGEDHAAAPPEELVEPATLPFKRDFIVPLVSSRRVRAHVVLGLALESHTMTREAMLPREPLYRDRLVEALLRHAAVGGFDDDFTAPLAMNRLRIGLNEALRPVLPPGSDATVLIVSLDRRDR